jgi:hypothetical protein
VSGGLIAAASTTTPSDKGANVVEGATGAEATADGTKANAEGKTSTAGSGGRWSASGTVYTFGFWFSFLIAALVLVAVVVCTVIKMARKSETPQSNDLVYNSLQDARQIYARMIK